MQWGMHQQPPILPSHAWLCCHTAHPVWQSERCPSPPLPPDAQSTAAPAGTQIARDMKPCMHTFQGAVMIADITGFTKLTEELSKQGAGGVELLTKCMNNYFTKVRCRPRAAVRRGSGRAGCCPGMQLLAGCRRCLTV